MLFLIYINDLPNGLSSNIKRFADDSFLFFVVHDIFNSPSDLNKDLKIYKKERFNWKWVLILTQTSKLKKLSLEENPGICVTIQ